MRKCSRNQAQLLGCLAACLAVCFLAEGCADNRIKSPDRTTVKTYSSDALNVTVSYDAKAAQPLSAALGSLNAKQFTPEDLWALSQCEECSTINIAKQFMLLQATSPGVLPEVLHAKVRQQALEDGLAQQLMKYCQTFQKTPSELIKLVKSASEMPILKTWLDDATKEKITNFDIDKQVRSTFAALIQKIISGSDLLDTTVPFSLNGFRSSNPAPASSFAVGDQAAKWAYIWSLPFVWSNTSTAKDVNTSLNMLHAIQTLLEWQYAFGIETKLPDGQTLGGLSLGVNSGDSLAPYDPVAKPFPGRFLAGTYSIQLPSNEPIDLALTGGEKWQNNADKVDLDEQAKLWAASAMALHRIRPRNIPQNLTFYGDQLPPKTAQLPIAFLPGAATLLDGPFIDQDKRIIRQKAALEKAQTSDSAAPAPVGQDPCQPAAAAESSGKATVIMPPSSPEIANLKSHARLLKALYLWTNEIADLQDLSKIGMDQTTMTTIATKQCKLKKAMQFGIQQILANFTKSVTLADGSTSMGLFERKDRTQSLDIASAAESLSILLKLEREMFPSPYISEKIDGMYEWFFSEVFLKIWSGRYQNPITPADVIWMYQAFKTYKNLQPHGKIAGQVQDVTTVLERILLDWNATLATGN